MIRARPYPPGAGKLAWTSSNGEHMSVAKHENPASCGMCGGSGKITVNNDNKEEEVKCPGCNGSGNA